MNITVLGAGAWGTTIASILAKNGLKVVLWSYEKDVTDNINGKKENTKYLPGINLSQNIMATTDLISSINSSGMIVSVIPTQFLRSTLQNRSAELSGKTILSASKGIEKDSLNLPSEIIIDIAPDSNIAVLSGPNLSKEIAMGLPAASVIACKDLNIAKDIQMVIKSEAFRVYTSDDIIGVELGGALKNVIAIAAGICDGLGLGNNAKSALIVRGMAEISRLGLKYGAKAETFAGLTGMGDLITTCQSNLSRNHYVGENLAKGMSLEEILKTLKGIPEGVETSMSAMELSKKTGIEMPICNEVYNVLFSKKDPKNAILSLMTRESKRES